jgi:REP element-mobilizing transposase RayT
MARQSRLDAPGALHHVMGRGIDGIPLFVNTKDRQDFIARVADPSSEDALKVYAWALMGNHFHLLIRAATQPLSKCMRRLLTGYVVNYNRRHTRYGHLFQNRYKSILCEEDPYLLELTRYIHLNPLRAGVVKSLKELRGYPWCGHSALMGSVERGWQDTDTVLAYFGKRGKRAIEKYEDFVREGIAAGRGLIRSLGGWSQLLSLRRTMGKVFSEERILGSSAFVADIISEAEQKARETLRLSSKVPDVPSLAKQVCVGEAIDETELRSGSRKRRVVKARKLFCQIAVKRMGYSGAEVVRFLGVTTSAVNRLAFTGELPEIAKYL